MIRRILPALLLVLSGTVLVSGQASRDARFKILGTMIAERAAARIAFPFGNDGIELTEAGSLDPAKIEQEIKKNGQSIEPGRVVTISAIDMDDSKIVFELDGGGKNKKAWYDRIEVGMGNKTTPINRDDEKKARGSKVTLKFAKKVPADITPELLHQLLNPVLDFTPAAAPKTAIDSLPPEFQEAVKIREARIGMDPGTVIMALGRPDSRFTDKDDDGNRQVTWLYRGRGTRTLFVWFQNEVVIKIAQY